MHGRIRRTLALSLIALATAAGSASATTLKADYRFDSTLASTVAGAPDLTFLIPDGQTTADPDNAPVYSVDGLSWKADRGLQLAAPGLVSQEAFSVVLRFKLATNTCYKRILGFRDSANINDSGLYSCSGQTYIYPYQSTDTVSLSDDTFAEVALTRATDGTLKAYTNGVLQATTSDTDTDYRMLESTLRLFRDDNSEESDGTISRLRVYDGALTAAQITEIAAGGTGDDTDGDGMLDSADACDAQAAATSDGCPVAAPTPAPEPTPTPTPDPTPAAPALPAGTVATTGKPKFGKTKSGAYRLATGLAATCAAPGPCGGTAVLTAKGKTLGSTTLTLPAGKAQAISITLTAAGAKALKKAGSLPTTVTVTLTQTDAVTVTATRKVRLKIKKKPRKKG